MTATMKKRANDKKPVIAGPRVRKRKAAAAVDVADFATGGPAADDTQCETEVRVVSSNTNGVGGEAAVGVDTSGATHATNQAASAEVDDVHEAMIGRRGKSKSAIEKLSTIQPVPIAAGGCKSTCDSDSPYATTCRALQDLQRRRVQTLKCRNSIDRQLGSLVAIEMGYAANQEETDRKARFAAADKLIAAIDAGDELTPEQQIAADKVSGIVLAVRMGRNEFDCQLKTIEKEMVRLAKTLPVAKWCEGVKGFGLKSLAVIIGETGDLSLYAGPAKAWKRLGLAPINGKMGSTWKRKGGLSAEEWTEAGYSPRRRSVMYVIGECLLKQNDGEYRKRYDESKAGKLALESEDWPKIRAHLHGMLLSTKLLVKHLWKQWNNT